MEDSILVTIKKLIGFDEDYTQFDLDIITAINSTFMVLNQLGVGPNKCFSITDKTATWSDFMSDETNLEAVKSYMQIKVRMLFDPPSSSFLIEAMNKQAQEYEWRLNITSDKS